MSDVDVTLAMPPSINSFHRGYCRRCRAGVRLILDKDARAWQSRAHTVIDDVGRGRVLIDSPVAVLADVYFDSRRRDLDGTIKQTLDVFAPRKLKDGTSSPGIWRDDRLVQLIIWRRHIDTAGDQRVRVRVSTQVPTLDLFADPWAGKDIEF